MTATIDPLLLSPVPTVRRTHGVGGRAHSLASRPSARVFRRRRMAVAAVAVFLVASVALVSGAFATEPSGSNLRTVPRTHVVQQGETLWSIAREYVPTGNISSFVRELARINGVDIQVGQVVRIP